MKLNKLFMLFGGVLMTGALLTSCSDDDNSYDVVGNGNNLNANEARLLGLLEEKDRQISRQQAQITKLLDMLAAR